MTALLIGREPEMPLGLTYTAAAPYGAVMIGSMSMGQLLHFGVPEALTALIEGLPVYFWLPGLEHRRLGGQLNPKLYAACLAAERELRDWGAEFISNAPKPPLITAARAIILHNKGNCPNSERMTPLARDILGGTI